MNSLKKHLCLGGLLIATSIGLSAQEDWKLAKDKQGIKVYTRKSPRTNLKDSRSEVVINTPIGDVYNMMMDFEKHKEWMAKVGESKIIQKVSDTEFYVYYIGVAPWPVSNRDIIAHYTIKREKKGKIRFEVIGEADYIPRKKDLIRVPKTESWWEFIPQDDGSVKVEYYTSSDPGGSIPQWLANTAAEDTPYNTLKKMKEMLEKK